MNEIRSAGIVGLGLIGGSLARDLAARGVRVSGYDTDASSVRAALSEGVIRSVMDPFSNVPIDADVVVAAVPVSEAPSVIQSLSERFAAVRLVTDVCSTKQSMEQAAARLGLQHRYIGSHPLAGDHRSGWCASRGGLFSGATVYICPGTATRAEPLALLRHMWESVGAVPEVMDACAHDRLLAWTSHLPQAVSSALARALATAGVTLDQLGPGGRDMTRLARSAADVWTPIAMDNAASLSLALDQLEGELAALRRALGHGDREVVRRFFELNGAERRDHLHGDEGLAVPPGVCASAPDIVV